MKAEIKKQQELMVKAIYIIDELQKIEFQHGFNVDGRKKALHEIYAETMAELACELVAIGEKKVNVTIHEQINY